MFIPIATRSTCLPKLPNPRVQAMSGYSIGILEMFLVFFQKKESSLEISVKFFSSRSSWRSLGSAMIFINRASLIPERQIPIYPFKHYSDDKDFSNMFPLSHQLVSSVIEKRLPDCTDTQQLTTICKMHKSGAWCVLPGRIKPPVRGCFLALQQDSSKNEVVDGSTAVTMTGTLCWEPITGRKERVTMVAMVEK